METRTDGTIKHRQASVVVGDWDSVLGGAFASMSYPHNNKFLKDQRFAFTAYIKMVRILISCNIWEYLNRTNLETLLNWESLIHMKRMKRSPHGDDSFSLLSDTYRDLLSDWHCTAEEAMVS